jgi:integrase
MTTATSSMMTNVERYLTHRRSLGYRSKTNGYLLRTFAQFADVHAVGEPLTIDLALRWATAPEGTRRVYHANRLDALRTFARYLAVFEPRTEIPPQRLLGPSFLRVPPHIYTPQEIAALIHESLTYQPSLRRDPLTGLRNATIIGLLACTGLRIGEALALKNSDVDLDQGLITVRQSKNLRMRLVPITDCAASHLRRYREARDQRFGRSGDSEAFIRSPRGGHLGYKSVLGAFQRLRRRAGLEGTFGRNPRLHDLRHTFACNHLLRAYRENRNIDNAVHELSIYLGHATLACTYWYLSGVPALLEQSTKRFEAHGLQHRKGKRS